MAINKPKLKKKIKKKKSLEMIYDYFLKIRRKKK